jgi:viroplasmin and RNaseH domain-containing protein
MISDGFAGEECEKHVKGYSRAEFKGFHSHAEAQAWISEGSTASNLQPSSKKRGQTYSDQGGYDQQSDLPDSYGDQSQYSNYYPNFKRRVKK